MIIFFIIILILCLVLMNQYKEQFNTNKIEFLGKDSSCKILKKINFLSKCITNYIQVTFFYWLYTKMYQHISKYINIY